jgi:predicted O-linked N-acetylglucosamine transferase (SPINDLY family)
MPLCSTRTHTLHNDKSIRIGFISGDFRNHSVGFFMTALARGLSTLGTVTYAYSTYTDQSSMQSQFRQLFRVWRDVEDLDAESLAKTIYDDQLDILIDLSGHTDHNRLGCLLYKPAPVIAHYLGYMASTGVPTIDYFVSDNVLHPPGIVPPYTEEILRLDRGYVAYSPFDSETDPAFDPHVSKAIHGSRIYGSFNNAAKYTDDTLRLWARLLKADPEGVLFMKSRGFLNRGLVMRVTDTMASHNVTSERLIFHPGNTTQAEHLAMYNGIHCTVDTVAFTGATTTCESLWMGTPVITLPQKSMKSRFSSSMLASSGYNEWICQSEMHYIEKAIDVASNIQSGRMSKMQVREKVSLSKLMDGVDLAKSMVRLLSSVSTL